MNNRLTNSVDPDETARDEPSHLDLHCLQSSLNWSSEMKGLQKQRGYGLRGEIDEPDVAYLLVWETFISSIIP